jgi:hypothetical protein
MNNWKANTWNADELVAKYPIKNIWEWKYTGNVITSKKRLFDIQDDPWNRDFKKIKDTFTVEEQGLLVYGFTQVEQKEIRLWSFV